MIERGTPIEQIVGQNPDFSSHTLAFNWAAGGISMDKVPEARVAMAPAAKFTMDCC